MSQITSQELYQKQNRIIHSGMGKLGMPYNSDKEYWLEVIGKQISKRDITSLGDLTLDERSRFITHLRQRGAKIYNPHVPGIMEFWKTGDPLITSRQKRPFHTAPEKTRMVKKIHAILADLKLPWAYVDNIAKSRFQKTFVEWLTFEELRLVVQMMAVHQRREKKKEMKGAA